MTSNDPQNWGETAARMFAIGKTLDPSRFPARPRTSDPDAVAEFALTCEEWGREMGRCNLPWQVWVEAVRWWCRNAPQDARWSFRAARDAALRVRDEWDANQRFRPVLDAHRQMVLDRRVARGELPPGATPVVATDTRSELGRWSTRDRPALPPQDRGAQFIAERRRRHAAEIAAEAREQRTEPPHGPDSCAETA